MLLLSQQRVELHGRVARDSVRASPSSVFTIFPKRDSLVASLCLFERQRMLGSGEGRFRPTGQSAA